MPKRTLFCLFAFLSIVFLVYAKPIAASLLATDIERVSIASNGTQGDDAIAYPVPVISGDGRITAFTSHANNLVPNDSNLYEDLFIHNRTTGETQMVNVDATGEQGTDFYKAVEGLSDDGRYAVFAYHNLVEDASSNAGIYVRDMARNTLQLITRGPDGRPFRWEAARPDISGDGNVVAFLIAGPVIPGDTTYEYDAYVYYRTTGTLVWASVNTDGEAGNDDTTDVALAGDGRSVAFSTNASNFYPLDVPRTEDIVVRNLMTGNVRFVSYAPNGDPGNAPSRHPVLSYNGRYVAFASAASNLVEGDTNGTTDIFVRDLVTGVLERVSLSSAGAETQEGTDETVAISGDGRYVAFISDADSLVPDDTNGHNDVFVHDRETRETERISLTEAGAESNAGNFYGLDMSNDGRYVMFFSSAADLVANDTNHVSDAFVVDRLAELPPPPTPTPSPTPNTKFLYLPLAQH